MLGVKILLIVTVLMEADVKMTVLVSGCMWLVSLLVNPVLDIQQTSDGVLASLEV